jgi:hypothetical protein
VIWCRLNRLQHMLGGQVEGYSRRGGDWKGMGDRTWMLKCKGKGNVAREGDMEEKGGCSGRHKWGRKRHKVEATWETCVAK